MRQSDLGRFILASGSPRRRELLAQIGLCPEVRASGVGESVSTSVPEEAVMELSARKARDIASRCEGEALILGADTVVALDGRILGKPAGHGEAYSMVRSLQGREHRVYTGVALLHKGPGGKVAERRFFESTTVWVYPMSEEEVRAYAESDDPLDKAGAYGIQGRFAAYIEKIEGDYYNVVGLPLGRFYQELKNILTIM